MKSIYTSLVIFFLLFSQAILLSKEEFLVGVLFVVVIGVISYFFGAVLQEIIFQFVDLWKFRFYKRFVFFHTVNQLLVSWARLFFILLQLALLTLTLKNKQSVVVEKNIGNFDGYDRKHIIFPIFENHLVVFYNMEKVLLLACLAWVFDGEKN